MKIIVIDARDSFVHVLADYVARENHTDVEILRPDRVGVEAAIAMVKSPEVDCVVLGPGPGHPRDSCHVPIARAVMGEKPILGVCLGHQVLGLLTGGSIKLLSEPKHACVSPINHSCSGIFEGIPQRAHVARYHSLMVESLPGANVGYEVIATSEDDNVIMGIDLRNGSYGVQFHAESHGSPSGRNITTNFVRLASDFINHKKIAS